ncbi:sigma-70 family RNA polymerase sigma factor [Catenulispora subtropica]|uniref:sigma-70 family RNA polymerase sigma factor n=1 Tax=Catenulispora subtropica TaxID=450798 RepID=UPI0031D154B2
MIAAYLPLIYNIVGRALDGHADVDDVVQETMLRAVNGMGDLRDPSAFRSWLVAIAMNQIRRRWQVRRTMSFSGLDEAREVADPGADFAELTVLRLQLSGQRREIAEATRWLDREDRDLLSLWWMEVGGELNRDEVVAALELSPQHVAVRVQRMKKQLDVGRAVVRALSASPRCLELASVVATWDGVPSPLWRKRIARHMRECDYCARFWDGLVQPERLLTRLALVPVPVPVGVSLMAARPQPMPAHSLGRHATRATSPRRGLRTGAGRRLRGSRAVQSLVGTAAAGVVAAGVLAGLSGGGDAAAESTKPSLTPPTMTVPPPRSVSSAPTPTRSVPTAMPVLSLEQQVVQLVNIERARRGCGPLRIDPKLHTAAQQHSADMAAHDYYEHDTPSGVDPGTRMTNAGYAWSTWGETLDRGPGSAAGAVKDWMGDQVHRDILMNCEYTVTGVGVVPSSKGTLWTQDVAKPE